MHDFAWLVQRLVGFDVNCSSVAGLKIDLDYCFSGGAGNTRKA
jgi:hypothetical protein